MYDTGGNPLPYGMEDDEEEEDGPVPVGMEAECVMLLPVGNTPVLPEGAGEAVPEKLCAPP